MRASRGGFDIQGDDERIGVWVHGCGFYGHQAQCSPAGIAAVQSGDMRDLLLRLLASMLLLTGLATGQPAAAPIPCEPVNPRATDEARALLRMILRCQRQRRHFRPSQLPESSISRSSDHAAEVPGKYPYIWGSDFGFTAEGKDAITGRDAMIEEAKRQYAAGSIITLMWHAVRPVDQEPNGWRRASKTN